MREARGGARFGCLRLHPTTAQHHHGPVLVCGGPPVHEQTNMSFQDEPPALRVAGVFASSIVALHRHWSLIEASEGPNCHSKQMMLLWIEDTLRRCWLCAATRVAAHVRYPCGRARRPGREAP